MKLITEICEDFEVVSQLDEASGKKRMYIEGIFMQGNKVNRNGRLYEANMLEEKVNSYKKTFVESNRAYGELGHPSGPIVNGERICMRIVELSRNGDNFVGKAQISDTPMGKIVEGLINDGGQLGVSSRGMGSLKAKNGINEVQKDFMLAAVDVVTDPSAHEAFVDGIMEGVEWIQSTTGAWVPEYLDETRKAIHKTSQSDLSEAYMKAFTKFVNKL